MWKVWKLFLPMYSDHGFCHADLLHLADITVGNYRENAAVQTMVQNKANLFQPLGTHVPPKASDFIYTFEFLVKHGMIRDMPARQEGVITSLTDRHLFGQLYEMVVDPGQATFVLTRNPRHFSVLVAFVCNYHRHIYFDEVYTRCLDNLVLTRKEKRSAVWESNIINLLEPVAEHVYGAELAKVKLHGWQLMLRPSSRMTASSNSRTTPIRILIRRLAHMSGTFDVVFQTAVNKPFIGCTYRIKATAEQCKIRNLIMDQLGRDGIVVLLTPRRRVGGGLTLKAS